jgi:hypothetical protein
MEFQLIDGFDMGEFSGIANPLHNYVDDGTGTGKRKLSETQAVDEATGLPLWILVMLKIGDGFRGNQELRQLEVTVPSKERPDHLRRGRSVEFSDLWVKVTTKKESYDVNDRYRASGFSQTATRPTQPVKENN